MKASNLSPYWHFKSHKFLYHKMEAKYSEIVLYLQFYYPSCNCSCSQQEKFKFSATEKCAIYFCKTQHDLSVNQTTAPNDSHSICLYNNCIFKENVFYNTLFFSLGVFLLLDIRFYFKQAKAGDPFMLLWSRPFFFFFAINVLPTSYFSWKLY